MPCTTWTKKSKYLSRGCREIFEAGLDVKMWRNKAPITCNSWGEKSLMYLSQSHCEGFGPESWFRLRADLQSAATECLHWREGLAIQPILKRVRFYDKSVTEVKALLELAELHEPFLTSLSSIAMLKFSWLDIKEEKIMKKPWSHVYLSEGQYSTEFTTLKCLTLLLTEQAKQTKFLDCFPEFLVLRIH